MYCNMKVILYIFVLFICFKANYCGLARTKCSEYAKAVYVKKESPVLTHRSKENLISECGIVSVPLIVGGSLASQKEFPHMALIGFGDSSDGELQWDCGGSLISDNYILTAAHCLKSRQWGSAQKVRLGTIHLESLDSSMQERLIIEKIPHPDYRPPSKANDIALIKLDKPVIFTPYVRPACLNTEEIKPKQTVLASGFGKLSYDAEIASKNLMKVLLTVYPNEDCSKSLSIKSKMLDGTLCAGQMAGGKDTCQGDSGGPLQIVLEKPYCMYSIVGVTSIGKFCGFANTPGIYTKVSDYVPWIEEIVW